MALVEFRNAPGDVGEVVVGEVIADAVALCEGPDEEVGDVLSDSLKVLPNGKVRFALLAIDL